MRHPLKKTEDDVIHRDISDIELTSGDSNFWLENYSNNEITHMCYYIYVYVLHKASATSGV